MPNVDVPAAALGLPEAILSGFLLAKRGIAANPDGSCQHWDAVASAVATGLHAMIAKHLASSEAEAQYWADILDTASCSLVHTKPTTDIGRGALLAFALAHFDRHFGVSDPLTGMIRNALASALDGIGVRS